MKNLREMSSTLVKKLCDRPIQIFNPIKVTVLRLTKIWLPRRNSFQTMIEYILLKNIISAVSLSPLIRRWLIVPLRRTHGSWSALLCPCNNLEGAITPPVTPMQRQDLFLYIPRQSSPLMTRIERVGLGVTSTCAPLRGRLRFVTPQRRSRSSGLIVSAEVIMLTRIWLAVHRYEEMVPSPPPGSMRSKWRVGMSQISARSGGISFVASARSLIVPRNGGR